MPWRERIRILLTRLRRATPAILLAIAGTYILSRLGTLHGLERLALDAEMAASPQPSPSVAIVNISNDDYDNKFGGKSPLDVQKLHDLISAIALSHPKVIGVDIDTSHPQFQKLTIEPDWPVIWERDISAAQHTRGGELEPLDVLGARDPKLNGSSGIPALLDDPEDKVTRLYTRCVETKAGPLPSFVYAVAMAYRSADDQGGIEATHNCASGSQSSAPPLFIRYSLSEGTSSLYEKDAAQVLGLSDKKENGGQGQIIPRLCEKIVLLGGTYRDFDRHFTPIGTLPGVLVLANAIQTELDGKPVKAYPRWLLFFLEFFASALLVSLLHLFPLSPAKTLTWGLPVTLAISLTFSFGWFHSLSRFASFAPTLLAVLVFEVYEHVRHESILRAAHSENKPEPANPDAKP